MGSCLSTFQNTTFQAQVSPGQGAGPGSIETTTSGEDRAAEECVISLCDTTKFCLETQRDAQLRGCRMVDTPPEPRFDAITKLMAAVFKTPVSLLTLIIDDRVWFKSKVGPFGACVSRDGSWCNYILVPNKPEVLITEDASVDARFASNPYVAGEPFIKFYAGAPLVGTGGLRYGTLCVVDLVPRSFSAEMYALLTNFAALAVQELERDNELLGSLVEQKELVDLNHVHVNGKLQRSLDALALVDVRAKPWPMLYANEAFGRAVGQKVEGCTQAGFWDQFVLAEGTDSQGVTAKVDATVASGRPARILVTSKASGGQLSLVLRPAGTDQLVPEKPVGVPNWVRSELELEGGVVEDALATDTSGAVGTIDPQLARSFYLVAVEWSDDFVALPDGISEGSEEQSEGLSGPDTPPSLIPEIQAYGDKPVPAGLPGLELGPLIGSGSFAKVYRGAWEGNVVAVKVVYCEAEGENTVGVLSEALLSCSLVHSNVVRTYAYKQGDKVVTNGRMHEKNTMFIIQQHCNRGTLLDAVEKGWLRKERNVHSQPSMRVILQTLRDVAEGMAYLHTKEVLHCDLTGNNVLLTASKTDPRGFTACVADFGLAQVACGGCVMSDCFGTVSHMSPEVLMDNTIYPASDVWSFGVLCWELYQGSRAYPGIPPPTIVYKVISGKDRLTLPEEAPAGFKELFSSCMEVDHSKRPPFPNIITTIDTLLGDC